MKIFLILLLLSCTKSHTETKLQHIDKMGNASATNPTVEASSAIEEIKEKLKAIQSEQSQSDQYDTLEIIEDIMKYAYDLFNECQLSLEEIYNIFNEIGVPYICPWSSGNILHSAIYKKDVEFAKQILSQRENVHLLHDHQVKNGVQLTPLELIFFVYDELEIIDILDSMKSLINSQNRKKIKEGYFHLFPIHLAQPKVIEYLIREWKIDYTKKGQYIIEDQT